MHKQIIWWRKQNKNLKYCFTILIPVTQTLNQDD